MNVLNSYIGLLRNRQYKQIRFHGVKGVNCYYTVQGDQDGVSDPALCTEIEINELLEQIERWLDYPATEVTLHLRPHLAFVVDVMDLGLHLEAYSPDVTWSDIVAASDDTFSDFVTEYSRRLRFEILVSLLPMVSGIQPPTKVTVAKPIDTPTPMYPVDPKVGAASAMGITQPGLAPAVQEQPHADKVNQMAKSIFAGVKEHFEHIEESRKKIEEQAKARGMTADEAVASVLKDRETAAFDRQQELLKAALDNGLNLTDKGTFTSEKVIHTGPNPGETTETYEDRLRQQEERMRQREQAADNLFAEPEIEDEEPMSHVETVQEVSGSTAQEVLANLVRGDASVHVATESLNSNK